MLASQIIFTLKLMLARFKNIFNKEINHRYLKVIKMTKFIMVLN